MNRVCGGCTLCCKLVPVPEIDKGANTRCVHQSSAGCGVHGTARQPRSCQAFACRWLADPRTRDMRRPDRARYVLDPMPDFVVARQHADDPGVKLPVIQVWCDPAAPQAHRDPALRAYLAGDGQSQRFALIRYSATDAFFLAYDPASGWLEMRSQTTMTKSHTVEDILDAIPDLRAALDAAPPELRRDVLNGVVIALDEAEAFVKPHPESEP